MKSIYILSQAWMKGHFTMTRPFITKSEAEENAALRNKMYKGNNYRVQEYKLDNEGPFFILLDKDGRPDFFIGGDEKHAKGHFGFLRCSLVSEGDPHGL